MLARHDRLDHGMVETLREMTDRGRPDFLGELISLFLDTFSGQLGMLFAYAEAGDMAGLQRITHDLRSSSAAVGAAVLASHCSELEATVRAGGTSGVSAQVWRIVEEFKAVRPELESLLTPARTPATLSF